MNYEIRPTRLGRIVIPHAQPPGGFLFYTTVDFDGRLDSASVREITRVIEEETSRLPELATCHQIHGTTTTLVSPSGSPWGERSECDALFTSSRDVALGIKVADCLPVTLLDSTSEWTANIHAGWRGASGGIVTRTLAAARRTHGTAKARAWLGPAIRECCFEVGEEVIESFRETFGELEPFVDRSRTKPHLSVSGVVSRSLQREGFADGDIIDLGLCTRCEGSMFHSYRRDGKNAGRNLAIVVC